MGTEALKLLNEISVIVVVYRPARVAELLQMDDSLLSASPFNINCNCTLYMFPYVIMFFCDATKLLRCVKCKSKQVTDFKSYMFHLPL